MTTPVNPRNANDNMCSKLKRFHLVIFVTVIFILLFAFTRMSWDAREHTCSKCLGNSDFESEDRLHFEQLQKRIIDVASLTDKTEYQEQVKSEKVEENLDIGELQYELEMGERNSVSRKEILENLKTLVSDLIELRATVDGHAAEAIEEKYNKFQRLLLDFENQNSVESKNMFVEAATRKNEGVYFCREERKKQLDSKVYVRRNCSKIPISKSVTILLDSPRLKLEDLEKIVRNIRKYYDNVTIKMAFESEVTQRRSRNRSMIINEIVQNITTPFVFVARYLSGCEENLNLERLIDLLSTSDDILAVGGAVKHDVNSMWSNGCLQTRLQNYTLSYKSGYHTSKHSCVKCDFLTGPFIAKTKTLQKFAFREELQYGIYEDWFLRMKGYRVKRQVRGSRGSCDPERKGYFYACTDVLTRVNFPDRNDSSLAEFANLWDIKKIIEANGRTRWYGCKRGIPHRQKKCRLRRGMAVPPCCLENLADAIKFIMKTCADNEIICELQEGTLLGAVKFQKVLPWERDADISFLTKHFEKIKILDGEFRKKGYILSARGKLMQ